MKAYVIFFVEEISNSGHLKQYQVAAHPTLAAFGGRVLIAYGRKEVVEGSDLAGTVTIEFPSYEAATGWYHSADYQDAKLLRDNAARCHAVIVEGRV